MRKVSLTLVFLCLAAWAMGQTSAPDNQSSGPYEQQGGQHHRPPGVAGSITAINPDSIVVKTREGQTVQVKVSDKTQFRKDRQEAKLADFKVGDEVFVRGTAAGENAWQADVVAARPAGGGGGGEGAFRDAMGKRFIVGQVKSINGTQLVIARPDGVTQTIAVDESTSFQKNGQSITLADLQPGDHVFGRGELKSEVFVPAVLNVGDPGMMGRGARQGRGQGQGQGQGQGSSEPQ